MKAQAAPSLLPGRGKLCKLTASTHHLLIPPQTPHGTEERIRKWQQGQLSGCHRNCHCKGELSLPWLCHSNIENAESLQRKIKMPVCCFHARWLSICCSFHLLLLWAQPCAVNCNFQNSCLCSHFGVMKFPIGTCPSVFLPRVGLQAVDAVTFMAFLVLRGNELPSCKPAEPVGSVPSSSLLDRAGLCLSRAGEVSEAVTPPPGSWPSQCLQQKGLDAVGWAAKPLSTLAAASLSRNLPAGEAGVAPGCWNSCYVHWVCFLWEGFPGQTAVHSELPHLHWAGHGRIQDTLQHDK